MLVCLTSERGIAQDLTGEIDGTVLDSTGAAVPNATVVVKNVDQNLIARTVHTNAQGQFAAPLLPLAHYSLTVDSAGFQAMTKVIDVHTGIISSVSFALQLGSVSQSVTVSTEDSVVEPQLDTAAAGTLIPATKITELSLSSRNFVQLFVIQPGVSDGIPGGTQDRGSISTQGGVNSANYEVNGIPPQYNGIFMDGQDLQRRSAGGTQIGAYPGIDFIQEMNLLRSNFSAQFGGSGSAFVNIATRHGNTEFHGSFYEFYRSQIFNANTYFNNLVGTPRPTLRYSDFGYALSGPVWIPGVTDREHAKTFFVFGQEFLRSDGASQTTLTNVPTAAQRTGIFTTPVCPTTSACSTGITTIPKIDATAQAYLTDVIDKFPLPNSPSDPQGLIVAEPGTNNESQTFVRFDHQFNDRLSAMFRFFDDPFNVRAPYGLRSNAQPAGTGTANVTDGDRAYYGSMTWVISPTNVLQGGGGYLRSYVTAQAIGTLEASNSPDVAALLPKLNPLQNTTGRIPNLTIVSTYATISPYTNGEPQTQVFANDTQTLGRHTLAAGFNLEWQKAGNNVATTNAGAFTFAATPVPTGSGTTNFQQAFANFLQGNASSFSQVSPDPSVYYHANVYEAYAQDDYHALQNLTLDMGVRYSYIVAPSSGTLKGHPYLPFVNFVPSMYNAAQAPPLTAAGLICEVGPCANGAAPVSTYNQFNGIIIANKTSPYGSKVYTQPNLTFAPRFGFSYDVGGAGKTAIRGGFGIYFVQFTTADYGSLGNQNQPNIVNLLINNTSFDAPAANAVNPTPQVIKAAQVNWQPPYTETYSFDVQHTFFNSMIVDIGYYGNRVLHQPVNEDINQPLPGAGVAQGVITCTPTPTCTPVVNATNTPNLNRVRPYIGFGPINSDVQNGISNYNGLQTSVTKRFSGGSLVTVNYTYSRALSDVNAPENIYNPGAEYGPDGSNRTNIANANFVYSLPFFRGSHSVAAYVLGGFEFSGIVGFGSGQFLTATTGASDPAGQGLLASGTAESTSRADYVSNPNAGAPHTFAQWFNKAAFAAPAAAQRYPGTSSNGSIIGPGYQDWDLSAYKNTALWRGSKLQLRVESFNTFNHTNFSTISTVTTASNYGQVTGAGPNRVLQLGAKVTF